MDGLPDYQRIEEAYRAVEEIVKKMPENNWTDRALENLKVSEGAAYQARERAKADRTETAPALEASASMEAYASTVHAASVPDWPQQSNCVRVGQTDAARFYEFYFDTKIDPGSVKVSCTYCSCGSD